MRDLQSHFHSATLKGPGNENSANRVRNANPHGLVRTISSAITPRKPRRISEITIFCLPCSSIGKEDNVGWKTKEGSM